MTVRNYRRPASGAGAPAAPNPDLVRPMGQVRRSQMISTYSVGAIVDLASGSCMPMGLEEWERQLRGGRMQELTIFESRLQAQLGVEFFRLPRLSRNRGPNPERWTDGTRFHASVSLSGTNARNANASGLWMIRSPWPATVSHWFAALPVARRRQ